MEETTEIDCLDSCPFLILINLYSFDFVVLALCLLKLILIFFHSFFFFIIYSVVGVCNRLCALCWIFTVDFSGVATTPLYHYGNILMSRTETALFPNYLIHLLYTEICQCCVAGSK